MINHRCPKAGPCLVLVLACALAAQATRADNGSSETPIHSGAAGPSYYIGSVYSFSRFSIEGRWVHGEQSLGAGELIEGSPGSTVDVRLFSVGRILLKNSGAARLAVKRTSEDAGSLNLLIASVVNGEMTVQLQQDAKAYIESGGSAFTSSPGAGFVIRIREGRSTIDIVKGAVDVEAQQPQLKFTGRTVQLVGNRIIPVTGAAASTINTNTRSAKRITTRWTRSVTKTSGLTREFSPRLVAFTNQTTLPDEPAANRRVQFETTIGAVDQPTVATPTAASTIVRTNSEGLATVAFNAGPNQGAGTITARILPEPGDPPNTIYDPYVWSVVVKDPGFLRTRNKILFGAAAAATLIISHPWRGKDEIRQQPPPEIQ